MKTLGLTLVLLCLMAVPAAAQIPDEFTNLELFPKDIGKRELVSAILDTPSFLGRDISLAGKLDPEAFWPHVDTIGGSRWPGQNGGPRRKA